MIKEHSQKLKEMFYYTKKDFQSILVGENLCYSRTFSCECKNEHLFFKEKNSWKKKKIERCFTDKTLHKDSMEAKTKTSKRCLNKQELKFSEIL